LNKVLISACLLGKRVRYDGRIKPIADTILQQWLAQGRLVSICPEVDAGMSIPRAPAEITAGDGQGVWAGTAQVLVEDGGDVSASFKKGAQLALSLCQQHAIKIAVLTEGSPSCGSSTIYDGSFSRQKMAGVGVTVALLQQHGIEVFSQYQLQEADRALIALLK